MRRHGEAGAPAAAVGAGGAADHHDAAVFTVLGRGVGIAALGRRLGHGGGRVFEGEEGGHRVGLEAFLQVFRRGGVDGGRAQEAGRADPDVEPAPGVEGFVDEGQRVRFRRDRVGVVDYFRVGVDGREGGGEAGGLLRLRARVDAGCAVGCAGEDTEKM